MDKEFHEKVQRKYKGYIVIYITDGDRFASVYGESAFKLSKIKGYKMAFYDGEDKTGFPAFNIEKILNDILCAKEKYVVFENNIFKYSSDDKDANSENDKDADADESIEDNEEDNKIESKKENILSGEFKDYISIYVPMDKKEKFCKAYEQSAIILNKLLNYKITNYGGRTQVGFPRESINKIKTLLLSNGFIYKIYQGDKLIECSDDLPLGAINECEDKPELLTLERQELQSLKRDDYCSIFAFDESNMDFYTGTYSNIYNNFTFINMPKELNKNYKFSKDYSTKAIIKNILLGGRRSKMSRFLHDRLKELGYIDYDGYEYVETYSYDDEQEKDINNDKKLKTIYIFDEETTNWDQTIKGNEEGFNPALEFFNSILPDYLKNKSEEEGKDYTFVRNLILPETSFDNILVLDSDLSVKDLYADFYLPQANIVIEIDGSQHKTTGGIESDKYRDDKLNNFGVGVIRIDVSDIVKRTNALYKSLDLFLEQIKESNNIFMYQKAYELRNKVNIKKIKVDAALRFEILLIELLKNQRLNEVDKITLNFINTDESYKEIFNACVEDIKLWLSNIYTLANININVPEVLINFSTKFDSNAINIDFSMTKKYTEAERQFGEFTNTIYVRNAYNDGVDYFKLDMAEKIRYEDNEQKHNEIVSSYNFFLQNIFGYEKFKNGQLEIIQNVLNENITIGILPTGTGKSLCYLLATLLEPAVSFAVSPIVALMLDQKKNFDDFGFDRTNYINSMVKKGSEKSLILKEFGEGRYSIIWISPERFQNEDFRKRLTSLNVDGNFGVAVIDEVHCLSEWGHDFRTSYLNLIKTIRRFCPQAILMGLTATASQFVLNDLKKEFDITGENIKTLASMSRDELEFHVVKTNENIRKKGNSHLSANTYNYDPYDDDDDEMDVVPQYVREQKERMIAEILGTKEVNKKIQKESNNILNELNIKESYDDVEKSVDDDNTFEDDYLREGYLRDILDLEITKEKENQDYKSSGLVFEKYANDCFERSMSMWNESLRKKYAEEDKCGNHVGIFHGRLLDEVKKWVQEKFINDEIDTLFVTKAFGMGINKKNIKYTVHDGLPDSLEQFYQEAGRAGRDERKDIKSNCYILYTPEKMAKEKIDRLFNIDTSYDEIKEISEELEGDLSKIFYLHLSSNQSVQRETYNILRLLENLYEKANFKPHANMNIEYVSLIDKETELEQLKEQIIKDIKNVKDREQLEKLQEKLDNLVKIMEDIPLAKNFKTREEMIDHLLQDQSNGGMNKYLVLQKDRTPYIDEKEIYKLSLLGLVKDWTITSWDMPRVYNVIFNDLTPEEVGVRLEEYIRKYQFDFDINEALKEDKDFEKNYFENSEFTFEGFSEKSRSILPYIHLLIKWQENNIIYNRKQNIKTMRDLCENFKSGRELKEKIDSYFTFDDSNTLIDRIVHMSSKKYESWIEVLFKNKRKGKKDIKEEKDTSDIEVIPTKEKEKIDMIIARYLESYQYNDGLNYLCGMIRLMLGKFDGEGMDRFGKVLDKMENEDEALRRGLIFRSARIVKSDNPENCNTYSKFILNRYPEYARDLYSIMEDDYSLGTILDESTTIILDKMNGMFD